MSSIKTTVNSQNYAHKRVEFDRQRHPFHILRASKYPFFTGVFAFLWLVPQVLYMHGIDLPLGLRPDLLHFGFLGLFSLVMSWFFKILKESSEGYHTKKVQLGLRTGMLLFILSEVMFFFAFFWGFFHYTLIPSVAVGAIWPPVDTQHLDVWGLPLVNTLLLLTSGVTITIAHAYLIKDHLIIAPQYVNQIGYNSVDEMVEAGVDLKRARNAGIIRTSLNREGFQWYLFLTVLLGVAFLMCQAYEYKYGVKFSWRENIYGSIFFVTTGFHGLHVTIGTLFLSYCLVREYITTGAVRFGGSDTKSFGGISVDAETLEWLKGLGFERNHHFGFEAAAWYWHFVDVVWLFLFVTVYWWGGR